MSLGCGEWGLCLGPGESQGKTTKARSPQGLTPGSFCPWLLFASYVLTLP